MSELRVGAERLVSGSPSSFTMFVPAPATPSCRTRAAGSSRAPSRSPMTAPRSGGISFSAFRTSPRPPPATPPAACGGDRPDRHLHLGDLPADILQVLRSRADHLERDRPRPPGSAASAPVCRSARPEHPLPRRVAPARGTRPVLARRPLTVLLNTFSMNSGLITASTMPRAASR